MLIDNETGAFTSKPMNWPGGPGSFHTTSVANDQVVALERLGDNGLTWVIVGDLGLLTGNGIVNFDLGKSTLRLDQASGTQVFADITTRRISP